MDSVSKIQDASPQSLETVNTNEEDIPTRRNVDYWLHHQTTSTQENHGEKMYGSTHDFLWELIHEVKKYRCIWDNSCRGFRELAKKQEAWKRIAEQFRIDEFKAQAEWNKLKENYRKCLKRREKVIRSGASNKSLPTCQYFREMSFINGTAPSKPETSHTNVPSFTNVSSFTNVPSFVTPASSTFTAYGKRKNLDTFLMQSIQKNAETPDEKDPEMLFCLSLVQELKDLSPQKKRKAKMKIMEVFWELNEEE